MGTKKARAAAHGIFVTTMLIGTVLLGVASVPYFFGDELHAFIIEKLPVPFEDAWLVALHAHVASALFALPLCLVLSSKRLIGARPALHRRLGRFTGVLLLFVVVPSGAALALTAKGGVVVTIGFLLSAAIVTVALVKGVRLARRGRMREHQVAMAHVTAQLSVAVTSRAMLVFLDVVGVDPDLAYVVALYIPVVASAAVVEFIVGARASHAALQIPVPTERSPDAHALLPRLVVDSVR